MPNYASLEYRSPSTNLGDVIQTLAAEQFLPRVDRYFDRDHLSEARAETRHLLIMNGWFTAIPENWPPSDSILPVFHGFHLGRYRRVQDLLLNDKSVSYFMKYEPIGCRDRETERLLAGKGIKAFYSRCLTLTFPKRTRDPQPGKIYLVDVDPDAIPLPKDIESEAVRVTHEVPYIYPNEIKRGMARFLLDLYRDEACLVITTKLHCALPCIAFGIPVIFFGEPHSYRLSILRDLGVAIHRPPGLLGGLLHRIPRWLRWRFHEIPTLKKMALSLIELSRRLLMDKRINWDPQAAPIDEMKAQMIEQIRTLVKERAGERR